MDFDPTPKIIRSQEGLQAYLIKYGVHLPSNVKSSGVLYTPNTQRLLRLGGVPSSSNASFGVDVPHNKLHERYPALLLRSALLVGGRGLAESFEFSDPL